MTFDLTPEQQAIADRARVVAKGAWAAGKTIDKAGRVPVEITHELLSEALADPFAGGEVAAVLIIEELASASAGLAASVGFGSAAGSGAGGTVIPPALPGLKGCEFELAAVQRSTGSTMQRSRLVCCGVALGVGRAAVTHAVGAMKRLGVRPGGDETVPHWALADAASEVEAARLLTLRAAQMVEREEDADPAIQLARTLSVAAAEKAVHAAIRVSGPDGYVRSSLLERLTRDARTLSVILPYQNDKTTATLP
jgi:alkylation response protein AidB-like acyl-CoA dehydrogenase